MQFWATCFTAHGTQFQSHETKFMADARPLICSHLTPGLLLFLQVRTLSLDDQLLGIVSTGRNPWDTAAPAAPTTTTDASTTTTTSSDCTDTGTSAAAAAAAAVAATAAPCPSPPPAAAQAVRQVVILGAGLDARAWRLDWPHGTHIWEVDTGSVEGLKSRALSSHPLRCAARTPVVADLAKPRKLRGVLGRAGVDWSQPVVWVLEGLIGYLTRDQAARLLGWVSHKLCVILTALLPGMHSGMPVCCMHDPLILHAALSECEGVCVLLECCCCVKCLSLLGELLHLLHILKQSTKVWHMLWHVLRRLYRISAPGSHLLLTCPPTPRVREELLQHGVELHHTTYEDPDVALARCVQL